MNPTVNLVAIVGSLREESFNRSVFDAAIELSGADVHLAEASLREVPLYDGDVEAAGDPASVVELRGAVDDADGLIIFTPSTTAASPP